MKRFDALKVLSQMLREELVVTSIAGVSAELFHVCDRDLNYYGNHCMGLASSVGLGLALALPGRRVIVLDGDGSLLMNLGSLATIANENPPNLIEIVFDNECYESPGLWPTATAGPTDLAAIGKGAGIKNSLTVGTLEKFHETLSKALAADELYLIVAKVEKGLAPVPPMTIDVTENTYRLLRALVQRGLIEEWRERDKRKEMGNKDS